MVSAGLEMIPEKSQQHLIGTNSTTIKTTTSANPLTKAARQNASTSSTNPIVIQLDGKDPPYVIEGRQLVQFQSPVQIIDARPNAVPSSVLLNDHGVPVTSAGQTSIEQLPIDKEKVFEPTPTAQPHLIPATLNLAPSGSVSAAHLSNETLISTNVIAPKEQTGIVNTTTTNLTWNGNVQTKPQLTQLPTLSKFPKISTNFDKSHAFQKQKHATI